MVSIMHRWWVHPDSRDEFRRHWEEVIAPLEDHHGLLQSRLSYCGKFVYVVNEFTSERKASRWESIPAWARFLSRWTHEHDEGPETIVVVAWLGCELPEEEGFLTIAKIIEAVGGYLGISTKKLISRERRADIAFARHLAMWFCKKFTPRSYPEIGMRFGGMDHTSVLHAYRRIRALLRDKYVIPEGGTYAAEQFAGKRLSEVVDEIKEDLGLPNVDPPKTK